MKKKNNIVEDAFKNVSDEARARVQKQVEDINSDCNANYGTDKSCFLQAVIKSGHKPLAITTLLAEETLLFNTEDEALKAAEEFLPEGWYYGLDEWETTWKDYVNKFYKGDESKAPKVYWINND